MIKVHKNLRRIYRSRNKRVLVMESPPQLRTIKMSWGHDCSGNEISKFTFFLSFPYIQFYLAASRSLYLSFSKEPVRNVRKDEITFPFLPNVYTNKLRVCLGLGYQFKDARLPSEQIMEGAVERFWNSGFYVGRAWFGCWAVPDAIRKVPTGYEMTTHESFCGQAIEQFKAWEEGSRKEGVNFISNLDWPHATFKNLPKLLLKGGSFLDCLVGEEIRNIAVLGHDG